MEAVQRAFCVSAYGMAKQKRSGLRGVKIAPDLQKTKISLDFFAYFFYQ